MIETVRILMELENNYMLIGLYLNQLNRNWELIAITHFFLKILNKL